MADPNRPRRNQTTRTSGLQANVEQDQEHLDRSEGFLINTLTDLTVVQTLIQDHSREPSNFVEFLDQRETVLRQAARLGGRATVFTRDDILEIRAGAAAEYRGLISEEEYTNNLRRLQGRAQPTTRPRQVNPNLKTLRDLVGPLIQDAETAICLYMTTEQDYLNSLAEERRVENESYAQHRRALRQFRSRISPTSYNQRSDGFLDNPNSSSVTGDNRFR